MRGPYSVIAAFGDNFGDFLWKEYEEKQKNIF